MLKAKNIFFILVLLPVLLFISSCKKQVVKKSVKSSRNNAQTLEDNTGGGPEVFSPVDDSKAKQFVRSLEVIPGVIPVKNQVSQEKVIQDQIPVSKSVQAQETLSPKPSDQEFLEIRDCQDPELGGPELSGPELSSLELSDTQNLEESEAGEYLGMGISEADKSELVRQKEAKLSDIPVPLNSEPLMEYFGFKGVGRRSGNNGGDSFKSSNWGGAGSGGNTGNGRKSGEIILGYLSQMDINEVVQFYNQEMEFFGWDNLSFFYGIDGIEKLMLFKKPSRICSISIRSVSNRGGAGVFGRFKKSVRSNSCDNKCEIIIFVQN